MKRKLVLLVFLLLSSWLVNSCEMLGGCKICRDVTYEGGVEVYATADTEYCDEQLRIKESTPDVHAGNQTIKVECR